MNGMCFHIFPLIQVQLKVPSLKLIFYCDLGCLEPQMIGCERCSSSRYEILLDLNTPSQNKGIKVGKGLSPNSWL
jgi:hypothetical protein